MRKNDALNLDSDWADCLPDAVGEANAGDFVGDALAQWLSPLYHNHGLFLRHHFGCCLQRPLSQQQNAQFAESAPDLGSKSQYKLCQILTEKCRSIIEIFRTLLQVIFIEYVARYLRINRPRQFEIEMPERAMDLNHHCKLSI